MRQTTRASLIGIGVIMYSILITLTLAIASVVVPEEEQEQVRIEVTHPSSIVSMTWTQSQAATQMVCEAWALAAGGAEKYTYSQTGDMYILGCALTITYPNEPVTQCYVAAERPYDWFDDWRLEVLGHELMHCFGGTHE